MTYGVEKLRRNQFGLETTPGTAVAATALWRGPAVGIKDDSEYHMPSENVGYLGQTDRGYFSRVGASLEAAESELTFEQLYPFAAGIKNVVSGVANGGTSVGYIYAYPLPTTTPNTITTYTVEAGDNSAAYRMAYSHVEKITLTGAVNQAVMISSSWRGRQKLSNAFTAALALQAVEEVQFYKSKLFLDDSGGTIGTSQKTGTFLGFSMTIATGWVIVPVGDGQLYYATIKQAGPSITGSITFEHDATGVAAEAKYVAGTTQLLRIEVPGAALTGTGGVHTTKLFRFDSAIKYQSVDALGSQDGDDTVTVNWTSVMGNAGQAAPTVTFVNTLAALV